MTPFAVLLALACGTLGAEDHVNLKETVEAYPVLKGMRILCVKRAMPKAGKTAPSINMLKGLGFPSNHECQSAVKKMNYNNEIGILNLATGRYITLYRPKGKNFVGNINLHWNAKRFLFTQSDEINYKIFEMNIDRKDLRQVSHTPDDVDCFEPCYLPDGRIIVNSNAPWQWENWDTTAVDPDTSLPMYPNGAYTIRVTAVSDKGHTAIAERSVTISNP
jgi:hypothetical protein